MASSDGSLVYFDFGATLEVSQAQRTSMVRMLVSFVNRDAAALVDDLVSLGFLPEMKDRTKATEAMDSAFRGANKSVNVAIGKAGGDRNFIGAASQMGEALQVN